MTDPRVFFAAERTLLAWVRSGLTVIGLGFVVARFGLFLAVLQTSPAGPRQAHSGHWPSNTLGILLVLLGTACILAALLNHRRYIASLPPQDVPDLAVPSLAPLLALIVSAAGLFLAAYLALA